MESYKRVAGDMKNRIALCANLLCKKLDCKIISKKAFADSYLIEIEKINQQQIESILKSIPCANRLEIGNKSIKIALFEI